MAVIPIDEMIEREKAGTQPTNIPQPTQQQTPQTPVGGVQRAQTSLGNNIIPIDQLIQREAQIKQDDTTAINAAGFTEAQFGSIDTRPSPLSFMQNLILSFSPNEETSMQFLQEQFAGAAVSLDPERGLMINGLEVNPKGFDGGDIPRSVGHTLPFLGQIFGGIGGGILGGLISSPTVAGVPVGVAGGAAVGGISGATLGEGIQLAIGELLGLDIDGKEVFDSLAGEARDAAFGEVLGLGLVGGGKVAGLGLKKLGKTRALKGIANLWKRSMVKAGSAAPVLAKFIGAVDEDATRIAQKHTFQKTLSREFFDPDKSGNIVKKLLFGTDAVPIETMLQPLRNGTTTQKGALLLVKSIKEIGENAYDDVIRQFTGMSDETLRVIHSSSVDDILGVTNLASNNSFNIAESFAAGIKGRQKELGTALASAESNAIRNSTSQMRIGSIARKIDKMIGTEEVLKGIKVKGFRATSPINTKGTDAIRKVRRIFGGHRTGTGEFDFFENISLKQARKLKNDFKLVADEIFANKTIPGQVKRVVKDAASEFRGAYYKKLNLMDESRAFRLFSDELDDLAISPNGIRQLENTVKNWRTQPEAIKKPFNALLDDMAEGANIRNKIHLQNAGEELSQLNIDNTAKAIEKRLTSKNILRTTVSDLDEQMLRGLDDTFKVSPNPALRRLAFMDKAEMSLAAKEFLKSSPNLLRVGAIASMMGLGGAGMAAFGPLGGIGGLAVAIGVTNPRAIGKLLVSLEKARLGGTLKRFISKAVGPKNLRKMQRAATPELQQRILNSLISQSQRGN